jgi:cytoplasmic iron level regulating protein YaaA (DUF328/UPF0246 family)
MISVVSPSKTQDFEQIEILGSTQLRQQGETFELIEILKQITAEEIGVLMKISEKLSQLNFDRFQNFKNEFLNGDSKQALWAFKGDVYSGINVNEFDEEDIIFVQDSLRMLSGLYGVIRPLDLIQPYRLEMGTRLENKNGATLYKYWGEKISDVLNEDESEVLINLASNEYFKGIDKKVLKARIINIHFKQWKVDKYKVVAIYAKRARGMMVNYIVKNRIDEPELLKAFDMDEYTYDSGLSSKNDWVFVRGK